MPYATSVTNVPICCPDGGADRLSVVRLLPVASLGSERRPLTGPELWEVYGIPPTFE